jgi:ABC-type transport system involved in multi-copper enzyme maturation permease subunit
VRLFVAELVKMRRRSMTWVLLITMIVVLAVVFLLIGLLVGPQLQLIDDFDLGAPGEGQWRVSGAIVGDFVFGMLGSLFAVIYAGGMVGADYSWNVIRNVIARGESRERYLLAKAAALAVAIAAGAAISFAAGIAMIGVAATVSGIDMGPFTFDALGGLAGGWGLGTLVLLERAAIALAFAAMLRSQLAGVVIAAILFVAEPIIGSIVNLIAQVSRVPGMPGMPGAPTAAEPHWTQFLPISIGGSVTNEAYVALPALVGQMGLVTNVPLNVAVPVVLLYTTAALLVATVVVRRQEIA